eukprot:TRINITY_DN6840_c0_g1_i1.p1 TRINITY_DN6840_c0_g1~~TRINITY_DN6840_c0_g1_i1.p1  ORF type:complete len:313 (+),score=73.58 TRINITY_DN6840_c0_g1_i1:52-939(+)
MNAEYSFLRSYAVRNSKLIDIGANITRLRGDELRVLLERSSAAGVDSILVTGTSTRGTEAARKMIENKVNQSHGVSLFFTSGIHPHEANEYSDKTFSIITKNVSHPNCVAVGETGLDYDRMRSPRETQLNSLRSHIKLAVDTNKPLFLHERDLDTSKGPPLGSHNDLVKLLEEYKVPSDKVCIHCFTSSPEHLLDYTSKGYYIGLTGFIAMGKRGAHLRPVLKKCLPVSKLLIETDAPYMKPDGVPKGVGIKGRNNEPCTLPTTLRCLAECYDMNEEDIAKVVTENTVKFFGLNA